MFTHVPNPLARGPQQVNPPGPKCYLVSFWCPDQAELTLQVLENTRKRGDELTCWPLINMDVHLARRLIIYVVNFIV